MVHFRTVQGHSGHDLIDPTAETDFGQTDFGHPYFPTLAKFDFGQTDFGQKNLTDFGHPY